MIGLGSDKKTTNQNNLPYLNLHFCRWLRLLLLLVVVLTRWSGCMSHNITSLSTLVVHFSSCTISQACIIGGKIRASCIVCNTENYQEENMTQPDGKSTTRAPVVQKSFVTLMIKYTLRWSGWFWRVLLLPGAGRVNSTAVSLRPLAAC